NLPGPDPHSEVPLGEMHIAATVPDFCLVMQFFSEQRGLAGRVYGDDGTIARSLEGRASWRDACGCQPQMDQLLDLVVYGADGGHIELLLEFITDVAVSR